MGGKSPQQAAKAESKPQKAQLQNKRVLFSLKRVPFQSSLYRSIELEGTLYIGLLRLICAIALRVSVLHSRKPDIEYALLCKLRKDGAVNKVPTQSLQDLLKVIPLQKRKELSTQIDDLCAHFQIENTFLVNQLTLSGKRRAAATKLTTQLKKDFVPRYWVEVVGILDPKPCTLAEAAKIMRVTETSLKVRVSSHRTFEKEIVGAFSGRDRGHIDGYYICSKMSEEEADHYREKFMQQLQEGSLPKFDIQSVSPTHQ